jgi:hypothetical protein
MCSVLHHEQGKMPNYVNYLPINNTKSACRYEDKENISNLLLLSKCIENVCMGAAKRRQLEEQNIEKDMCQEK